MNEAHIKQPPFDFHLASGFFDDATCRDLIAELRKSDGAPALTYGKGESGGVDERVRKVARLAAAPEIAQLVRDRLVAYREKLAQHFEIGLTSCEEPQFLCYRVGDFFVAHQDGNTGLVRLDTDARRVSVSIFLNSHSEQPGPDSYGGGALVFSDWRKDLSRRIAGEAGTLLAFRSELTHEVIPVTHGERYSIVSWYR